MKPSRPRFPDTVRHQRWSRICLALLAILLAGSLGDALKINRRLRHAASILLGSPRSQLTALSSATGYSAVLQRHRITGMVAPKGLSYNVETGTFFTVLERDQVIAEFDVCGVLLRRIQINTKHELEEVAALGSGLKLLTLAKTPRMLLLPIRDGATSADLSKAIQLDVRDGETPVEVEEVAWDPVGNRLFLGASEYPPRIYVAPFRLAEWLRRAPGDYRLQASEWLAAKDVLALMPDITALAYSAARGRLLILSDETREIVSVGEERRPAKYLQLEPGTAGLEAQVRSPEGMAIAGDASLYLISDPDDVYLYRFIPEVGLGRQSFCQSP